MADDLELTDEEREQILERRKEKRQKAWKPRAADAYSPEEKAAAFDKFHKMALEHFELKAQDGFGTKDIDHWTYEEVMGLLGDGVFDALNSLDGC